MDQAHKCRTPFPAILVALGSLILAPVLKADPPVIKTQPQSASAGVGAGVGLNVDVSGSAPPLTYQWQFNGANLSDNGRIFGSQTCCLFISSALTNDTGNYQVTITNPYGSVTSAMVTLTVTIIPPI